MSYEREKEMGKKYEDLGTNVEVKEEEGGRRGEEEGGGEEEEGREGGGGGEGGGGEEGGLEKEVFLLKKKKMRRGGGDDRGFDDDADDADGIKVKGKNYDDEIVPKVPFKRPKRDEEEEDDDDDKAIQMSHTNKQTSTNELSPTCSQTSSERLDVVDNTVSSSCDLSVEAGWWGCWKCEMVGIRCIDGEMEKWEGE